MPGHEVNNTQKSSATGNNGRNLALVLDSFGPSQRQPYPTLEVDATDLLSGQSPAGVEGEDRLQRVGLDERGHRTLEYREAMFKREPLGSSSTSIYDPNQQSSACDKLLNGLKQLTEADEMDSASKNDVGHMSKSLGVMYAADNCVEQM